MVHSRLPTINSTSSAFGCFVVLIILCFCFFKLILNTQLDQQNAENQKIIEATVITQQIVNHLVSGLDPYLPSLQAHVLETKYQYVQDGKSNVCVIKSLPLSNEEYESIRKSTQFKIGNRQKIFVTSRDTLVTCKIDRFRDIVNSDWIVILIIGVLIFIFGALYVNALKNFIQKNRGKENDN